MVTSAAMVHVLPVPALASSRVVPGARSAVMSKVSMLTAPGPVRCRCRSADCHSRQAKWPSRCGSGSSPARAARRAGRSRRARRRRGRARCRRPPWGSPESLKRGVSHSLRAFIVGVAVGSAADPAELLGPGQRRLRPAAAAARTVRRRRGRPGRAATPARRAGRAGGPCCDLAPGAVLADRVGGPVLVGETGREGQRVDPGREPVLGAEVGEGHGDEVVAADVADGAEETRRRRGRRRRRGCAAGRGAARGPLAREGGRR